jgi:Tfp pilus assembly protein PilE
MSTHAGSQSRAFFLELVLNLVIFALCAAVCLQVFVNAKLVSEHSSALSHLSIEAQMVAESFKSSNGDAAALAAAFGAHKDGSSLTIYYDGEFQPVATASAPYHIRCDIDDATPLKTAVITVYRDQDVLFTLEAKRYVSGGR